MELATGQFLLTADGVVGSLPNLVIVTGGSLDLSGTPTLSLTGRRGVNGIDAGIVRVGGSLDFRLGDFSLISEMDFQLMST